MQSTLTTVGGTSRSADVCARLFAVCLVLFAYCAQEPFKAPTALSRLDLLHSVVLSHTLAIDAYGGNTPDEARFGGHIYSDKAPGAAALALPVFALEAGCLHLAGVRLDSEAGWLVTSWAACVFSQALPAALGTTALWLWLAAFAGARAGFLAVVFLYLGSMPLPYATMLFSHAEVVGLLSIGIWALRLLEPLPRSGARGSTPKMATETIVWPDLAGRLGREEWHGGLAGLCLGLALASEYTAGLPVVALVVYAAVQRRSRLSWLILGAIPPLLLIPAYSWATVGSPFSLPYSYQASFPQMKEGLYGIKWPNASTAFNLLFSPERGLFFWSPFLLMAGAGHLSLGRRSPVGFWLTYGVPLLQLVVISGRVWDWQAGPTIGPRYLAPVLPLLALPCALGVRNYPRVGVALGVYSVAVTTLVTLTDPCPDYTNHPNPFLDLTLPLFVRGDFAPNLGLVLGLPPYASVALFYALLAAGIWWVYSTLPPEGQRGHAAPVA